MNVEAGGYGALNLAQGALVGVGAYATALLAPTLGPLALPAAVVVAGLLALLAGLGVIGTLLIRGARNRGSSPQPS